MKFQAQIFNYKKKILNYNKKSQIWYCEFNELTVNNAFTDLTLICIMHTYHFYEPILQHL